MSPADYERLVKSLMNTEFDGMDAKAFHLKKYMGKSGQPYEIDISFEVRIGTLELTILVECKRYKRPVTVQEVADFAYRVQDVGAHKGVLVSPNGFQRGALKVAKAEKIALLIVRDEIELKPREIQTVIGLMRMIKEEYLPWFSGLRLKGAPDGVGDVTLEARWSIPKNINHHVVGFGATDNALREPEIRRRLQDYDAYFSPCFLLIEEEAAAESE
jgi:Restriction endonuclease